MCFIKLNGQFCVRKLQILSSATAKNMPNNKQNKENAKAKEKEKEKDKDNESEYSYYSEECNNLDTKIICACKLKANICHH